MTPDFTYPGKELELFSKALHWKKYVASLIKPFIKGNVAEVGAGTGNFSPYLLNEKVTSWTYIEPDEQFRNIISGKIAKNQLHPGNIHASYPEPGAFYDTI